MVFYAAFNAINSVISRRQLTLFMSFLGFTSTRLGIRCVLPKDAPLKKNTEDPVWLWPCAYKTFFMLNSAEHEISMLSKSNLVNLLDKLLACGDTYYFCQSNQSFEFNLQYSLKHKLDFKG